MSSVTYNWDSSSEIFDDTYTARPRSLHTVELTIEEPVDINQTYSMGMGSSLTLTIYGHEWISLAEHLSEVGKSLWKNKHDDALKQVVDYRKKIVSHDEYRRKAEADRDQAIKHAQLWKKKYLELREKTRRA